MGPVGSLARGVKRDLNRAVGKLGEVSKSILGSNRMSIRLICDNCVHKFESHVLILSCSCI